MRLALAVAWLVVASFNLTMALLTFRNLRGIERALDKLERNE